MSDLRKLELPDEGLATRTMGPEERAEHERSMSEWWRGLEDGDERGAEDGQAQ